MPTTALARLASGLAVLLLIADKYSWGRSNPPIGVLGGDSTGQHAWQVVVAMCLGVLLAFTLVAVGRHPSLARRAALLELFAFVAFNAALVSRDGAARFTEWGYGEMATELLLVVLGLTVRGFSLVALSKTWQVHPNAMSGGASQQRRSTRG